jgi:hypothetical protein
MNFISFDASANNNVLDQLVVDHDQRQGDLALRAVERLLARFIAYPSGHARVAHALWCVHAHMMECWDTTPRLAFLSPEPGSGKTRALEITELLVPRPVSAVNVSPAYLFRKVASEEGAPTILFDEIDTVFGPKAKENEEIRGLLNAGHRRGAVAGRCVVRGTTIETEEIPAYAAVALAGLGWLPDTIMSRSVVIRMRRRAPGEHVEPFRRSSMESRAIASAPRSRHGLRRSRPTSISMRIRFRSRSRTATRICGNPLLPLPTWPAVIGPPGPEPRLRLLQRHASASRALASVCWPISAPCSRPPATRRTCSRPPSWPRSSPSRKARGSISRAGRSMTAPWPAGCGSTR